MHHDTLPSTSRSAVHDSEADKFRRAGDDSRQLLVKSMSHVMSTDDIEKFDKALFNQSVRQHLVFNEATYPRE